MLDDLNELKTFRTIMAAGSLSAAAARLGLSLSVVSKRLATLEARAGTRLVNRSTRALSPTDEGAALLQEIERALTAIEAGEDLLLGSRLEPVGMLQVTAPMTLGRRHVAPVLGALARRHSRLEVRLNLTDRIVDIVAEGIDVAIRIGTPVDSTAVMLKLAENVRILVAAPSYLDAAGRPQTPAEAASHSYLRYGDASQPWNLANANGDRATLAASPRLRVDSGDVMHDWALEGHGIMLKSEIDVADDLRAGRLERVLPEWNGGEVPIVALYSSARNLPLKSRFFLDEMIGAIRTP